MEEVEREDNQQVLRVLELLKEASHDLQSNPSQLVTESNSSAIKALLELETESGTILSDQNLNQLSQHLSHLKTLVETLHKTRGHSLRSFLRRRVSTHQITRVAESIESELQAWIDRESIESLVKRLHGLPSESPDSDEESELIHLLTQFRDRVSQGFNRELQDLVLKSGIFSELETFLCNPDHSKKLREESAFTIEALIRFNKNVFVGQVWMGPTIKALVSMASGSSLEVLCSLIKSIKSPLVDEIEANDAIPSIIRFLSSEDLAIQVLGFNCVLEIGYFGRKEAIEAMIREELIQRLVEMQRSELGGDLIEVGKCEEEEEEEEHRGERETEEGERKQRRNRGERESYLEKHPFASCVARFAVQLEVGEGLRQREKRAFKQEILKKVGEASVSDAEAATIQAEVLWEYGV
ncbi:hypothetical protein Cgig2_029247 [Carnegiea gigantea]|uniref:Uncharacterized protein n=1 Tax=Carnegiea gigantea TaxID=171969 RepID=A0A9Q1KU31_9CARY|nr:hypothetical protein Cgig2_029247 [Carnegiea gigantea]